MCITKRRRFIWALFQNIESNVLFFSCSLFLTSVLSSKSPENCGEHPEKTPEEIKDILKHWKIIPDVIPKSAPGIVKVAYGEKIVNFGNNLTKTETWNPPTYVHWETEPECFYCLIMADPDFPDASFKSGQWQHWKVGNIPGTDLAKGQSMSDYIGVQAPQGTVCDEESGTLSSLSSIAPIIDFLSVT
ncbi:protein D1 isoform X3 [Bemisia tabaci]|uniref:protein D1 isoform X3 n=1 Tax=Bemisia tabaci TaxID=7038 RepID=UPI003B28682E